jgi:5,10-methylenetetrahydromethanopterin reductase
MEFGIAFIPDMPAAEAVDLVRLAESLGYGTVWLPDQTFHRDPFVLLGLCAQATTRVTLGLAVTNPYTRHPVQIVRAAAVVDEIAGGRFILGLGAGNRSRVLGALGLAPSGAEARIEECIAVCRRLFRGERVTYRSPTLVLNGCALDFAARPDLPIYVASRGPRVLKMAGRVADGVLIEGLFTPGGLAYGLGQIAEGVREAGRDPAAVRRIAWQSAYLSNDPDAAASPRFRRWAGLIIHGTQDWILERIGIPLEVVGWVRQDFAARGEEELGRRVPPDVVRKVLMVGTAAELAAHADVLAAHGIDMMSIIVLGGTDDVRDTLRRFAAEVMSPRQRGMAAR